MRSQRKGDAAVDSLLSSMFEVNQVRLILGQAMDAVDSPIMDSTGQPR